MTGAERACEMLKTLRGAWMTKRQGRVPAAVMIAAPTAMGAAAMAPVWMTSPPARRI